MKLVNERGEPVSPDVALDLEFRSFGRRAEGGRIVIGGPKRRFAASVLANDGFPRLIENEEATKRFRPWLDAISEKIPGLRHVSVNFDRNALPSKPGTSPLPNFPELAENLRAILIDAVFRQNENATSASIELYVPGEPAHGGWSRTLSPYASIFSYEENSCSESRIILNRETKPSRSNALNVLSIVGSEAVDRISGWKGRFVTFEAALLVQKPSAHDKLAAAKLVAELEG